MEKIYAKNVKYRKSSISNDIAVVKNFARPDQTHGMFLVKHIATLVGTSKPARTVKYSQVLQCPFVMLTTL